MDKLENQILEIAKQNPKGFTISLNNLEMVKKGWVVASKETQNCFGLDGLKKVIAVAETTTGILGGWLNETDFYFDAVFIVENETEATKLGIENQQIAIYNIETQKLKFLN